MDPIVIAERGLVFGHAAAAWAYGTLVLGLVTLAGFVVAWLRARALAAAERRGEAGGPPALAAGPAVVHGVVASDRDVPLSLRIVERCHEPGNEAAADAWRVIERTVAIHPFELRRSDGTTVRVEAARDVELVADPAPTVDVERGCRVREPCVRSGEPVTVLGVLEPAGGDGYRDAAVGWTLRAPRRAPLVISKRSLQEHFAAVAKVWRGLTLAALAFVSCQQVVVAGEYYVFSSFGHATTATIDRLWEEPNGDGFRLCLAGLRENRHEADLPCDRWEDLAPGDVVSAWRAGGELRVEPSPGVLAGAAFGSIVLGAALSLVSLVAAARPRPW